MVPQQVFFVLRGHPYLRGSLIRGSTIYVLSRKEEMPWVNGFESMTFTLFTRISSGLLEYRQTVLAIPFQLGQLGQLHGKHTKKNFYAMVWPYKTSGFSGGYIWIQDLWSMLWSWRYLRASTICENIVTTSLSDRVLFRLICF